MFGFFFYQFLYYILSLRNFFHDTCGSQTQVSRDRLLASFLSKDDFLRILCAPESKHIKIAVTKEVMRNLSNLVTHVDVQNVCDEVGISNKGYAAIHRLLKDSLMKRGITENIFPVPRMVKLAKTVSNEDVYSKLGEYMHVEDTMYIDSGLKKNPSKRQKTSKLSSQAVLFEEKGFPYSKFNIIFVDLKKLQRAMVTFYRLSPAGLYSVFFIVGLFIIIKLVIKQYLHFVFVYSVRVKTHICVEVG